MNTYRIAHKDTIALVTAEDEVIPVAAAAIRKARLDLEEHIQIRPQFGRSLSPLPDDPKAPLIARRMIQAAARAGVGPMAAVAGATAEAALRAMIKAGAKHAVVSNGGDIAMMIDRPVTVGVFAGRPGEDAIGLRFAPRRGIIAVCTSSGTVGHSLSFGRADAATVVARDAALADAAATALGNAVRIRSEAGLLEALEKTRIPGIEGMLVVAGPHIAAKGRLPEIVRARIGCPILDLDMGRNADCGLDSSRHNPIPPYSEHIAGRFPSLLRNIAVPLFQSTPPPSSGPAAEHFFSLFCVGHQSRAATRETHLLESADARLPAASRGVCQPVINKKNDDGVYTETEFCEKRGWITS